MAYSISADIEKVLERHDIAQLTDDDTGGQSDEATITDSINDADSLIDSYLGTRYTVPLTTIPAVVRRASATLAVYYLHARKPEHLSDEVQQLYDQTVAWLKDISSTGKADIPVATTTATDLTGYFDADDRLFVGDTHGHDSTFGKF